MNPDLQLRDIHLPADVGWWPPAFGWWLLALLLFAGLYLLFRRWRSDRPQALPAVCSSALDELTRLEQEHDDNPNQLIRGVSVLLRRTAMSLYGRHRVSGLSGDAWLEFLDQQHIRDEQVFGERFQRMLTELPYREHSDGGNVGELVQVVRSWLEQQDGWQRSHKSQSSSEVAGGPPPLAKGERGGFKATQQRGERHV